MSQYQLTLRYRYVADRLRRIHEYGEHVIPVIDAPNQILAVTHAVTLFFRTFEIGHVDILNTTILRLPPGEARRRAAIYGTSNFSDPSATEMRQ